MTDVLFTGHYDNDLRRVVGQRLPETDREAYGLISSSEEILQSQALDPSVALYDFVRALDQAIKAERRDTGIYPED